MKTVHFILIPILLFAFIQVKAQEEVKKSKQELKLEKQKQVEEMVNSKTFIFEGTNAYSEGGKSVNITSGPNMVYFSPDRIKSDLPFFGQARSASAGYGTPGGYKFEGKPDEFTIENAKKGYSLKAVVKTVNETFTLNMSIGTDGNANLYVYSINRSSMRYNGEITKPKL
jgi:hypothetical protein